MSGEAVTVTQAEMAAFGASDAACYLYPGEHQAPERAAFCAGAAHVAGAAIDYAHALSPTTTAGDELVLQIRALVGFCDDGAVTPKVPHTAIELLRSAATRIQSDAATIAGLREHVERLEAAARPFVNAAEPIINDRAFDIVEWGKRQERITIGQYRALSLATSKGGKEHG